MSNRNHVHRQDHRYQVRKPGSIRCLATDTEVDVEVQDMSFSGTKLKALGSTSHMMNVELHLQQENLFFTLNGDVKYSTTSPGCPRLAVRKGARFLTNLTHQPRQISHEEIEVDLLTINGMAKSAFADAETYRQESGHAFTVLDFEKERDEEDEDGTEDTFDRFLRNDR